MYMSHHLRLLTFDPAGQNISTIRNAMAEELFLGVKEYPLHQNTEARATSKRCITATQYKQRIGKTVVLYCSASEGVGKNFTWTHNGRAVSSEQEQGQISFLANQRVCLRFCPRTIRMRKM